MKQNKELPEMTGAMIMALQKLKSQRILPMRGVPRNRMNPQKAAHIELHVSASLPFILITWAILLMSCRKRKTPIGHRLPHIFSHMMKLMICCGLLIKRQEQLLPEICIFRCPLFFVFCMVVG